MQWGRLYGEWAHDLKIQTLPEAFQRRHAMLLCMHIEGLTSPADEDAAFYMRVTLADWLETKAAFLARGLLDETNHLINWERRQYKSDNSAARTRKYRETSPDRHSDVTVTPPDTESDTDTETEAKEKKSPPAPPPGGEVADDAWPRPESPADSPLPGEKAGASETVSPSGLAEAAAPTHEKHPSSNPAEPLEHQGRSDGVKPLRGTLRGTAEAYNRLLPHLPPHQVWSDRDVRHFQRNRQLDPARGSPEFWIEKIFPQVAQSPFLSGRVPAKRGPPWRASLPWLLNPDNVAKILNGHYAGESGGAGGYASEKASTSSGGQPLGAAGGAGSDRAKNSASPLTSTRGGKPSAPDTRLPAPQEFAHEIKPIGSKNSAQKRGENLPPPRGLHRPESGGG